MIGFIFRKIFGTYNDRMLKKVQPLVEQMNALEATYQKLSDDQLKSKTEEFRSLLKQGKSLEDIQCDAFAAMREACKRTIGLRPYDCQLIGGLALHRGMIAEMTTGEGKTLVATLPAYLNALDGKGVHVITVNDYLASRDRNWMGPAYEFMGLTVGVIRNDTPIQVRKLQYACDITYGTNNEFGFDYLRNNMVVHGSQCAQRALNYCIVDEVDSILIDEARTPLIISGPTDESTDLYYKIDRLIPTLKTEDFTVEEKTRTVALTDDGVHKSEKFLGIENLYDPNNVDLVHHVSQALRAHKLFKKDVDYVVQEDQVVIVDEFTGRLMPGRRFSDGLHQALEAKEKVKIEQENQTLASVTFQNFFRMYSKLSGMTGTASTEAQEFQQIYKLLVLTIPTNKPLRRQSFADAIYRTDREKYAAVIKNIKEMNVVGRPVLVGTVSIEKSELVSHLLKNENITHTVLNAKYHEKEAEIISRAGQPKSVTIATNMAGRGTDIVLGEGIAALGGLHVIGTERHESRRIDNQLRGRTGRQGDPGSSQFFLSLEDDLLRIFGSDRISGVMQRLGMEDGESIQHSLVTRSIESAQARVEGRNFDIRKELLKFDDIMNSQRLSIYAERREILEGQDVSQRYKDFIEEIVDDAATGLQKSASNPDDDQAMTQNQSIADYLRSIFPIETKQELLADADEFKQIFSKQVLEMYSGKESHFGAKMMRGLERIVLLEVIDSKWKDHLRGMDELREGIGLRAYGQKDPIVEFRSEGYSMFEEMSRKIREDAVSFILRANPIKEEDLVIKNERMDSSDIRFLHPEASSAIKPAHQTAAIASSAKKDPFDPTIQRTDPGSPFEDNKKIGRNEPCSCGSGKKYKKCCGV